MVKHTLKISTKKNWQQKINGERDADIYFVTEYLFFSFPVPFPETNPKGP